MLVLVKRISRIIPKIKVCKVNRMKRLKIQATVISILLLAGTSSCNSVDSGPVEKASSKSNVISVSTLLTEIQQDEKIKRFQFWDKSTFEFFQAVRLSNPKSSNRDDLIVALAVDLAEAKGLASKFKSSEFEIIRVLAAAYVSDIAIAIEEMLDAFSANDQVMGVKAFAQLEYLQDKQEKISLCVVQDNFNC